MCVRGSCRLAFKTSNARPRTLNESCLAQLWPNVSACAEWYVDGDLRVLESNNVPPYDVPPYCPFGIGQGYCQSPTQGDSTDCDPFRNLTCPCTGSDASCFSTTTGDVMAVTYQLFEFPLHPDPTNASKPVHMYDNNCLKNGNTYQVIGAHLNGVQIKGPAEANGFNVDTSLIPLPCGGHVTPPVGTGPGYHYHKASDCLDISMPGDHGPMIGYAADGFAIYGFGDVTGSPVLDECHGHFGPTSVNNATVTYHYHASPATNVDGETHKPYYLGCLGPSKGQCQSVGSNPDYDDGANWCGAGCGYDVCVQPGTDEGEMERYLELFTSSATAWLANFTVNSY